MVQTETSLFEEDLIYTPPQRPSFPNSTIWGRPQPWSSSTILPRNKGPDSAGRDLTNAASELECIYLHIFSANKINMQKPEAAAALTGKMRKTQQCIILYLLTVRLASVRRLLPKASSVRD